jgi:DNA-directed RNA polymerase specialized sigma24 family protein
MSGAFKRPARLSPRLPPEERARIYAMRAKGFSVELIAETVGLSRVAVEQLLRVAPPKAPSC